MALEDAFDAAVEASSGALVYRRSFYEKHNEAVTLTCSKCGHAHAAVTHGEVAHIHPFDGSMHMVLSVRDAAALVAGGWGERHGLAGLPKGPPLSYVLVYAPRTRVEVEIITRVLAAAIAHMAGERTRTVHGE